jgi:transcriptional regulator with XRE-family HTH domain
MDKLLFDLKPIGIGSNLTESMLSYISRVANANGISLRDVVSIIKDDFPQVSTKANKISLARYGAINGVNSLAKAFSDTINSLSLNNDVCFMTMLTWAEVISARKLIRDSAAWCSQCYQEWKKQKKTIYLPLIWSLNSVEICKLHRIRLRNQCPYCKQEMNVFLASANPGYCANCNEWLGLDQWYEHSYTDWDIWAYDNVDNLIAVAAYTDNPPKKEIIATNLEAIVNKLVLRNQVSVARLSRLAGIPKNTMHEWYSGNSIPPLDALLKICKSVNVTLTNFLTRDLSAIDFSSAAIDFETIVNEKQKKRTGTGDLDKIRKHLEDICLDTDRYISLSDISKQIEVDEKTLRKHFPDLTKTISGEERKIRQLCTEVKNATLKLHNQGVYPSRRKVDELCSLKGINTHDEVKKAWKKTKKELGY